MIDEKILHPKSYYYIKKKVDFQERSSMIGIFAKNCYKNSALIAKKYIQTESIVDKVL